MREPERRIRAKLKSTRTVAARLRLALYWPLPRGRFAEVGVLVRVGVVGVVMPRKKQKKNKIPQRRKRPTQNPQPDNNLAGLGDKLIPAGLA